MTEEMIDDRPTVGSLFAGIGGFDLAFERAGFRVAWQVEWDEACRVVLGRRFGEAITFNDVREVGAHNLTRVDVLVGGWPCQPVSVAGRRRASSDERDMWPEFARIARELAPAWVVGENVPGVLTAESGAYFGRVLDDLDGLGYGVCWRTLDARHFGVPQRRRRVFVVGRLGNLERPASVLLEPEGVRGDSEASGAPGSGAAGGIESGAARALAASGGRWRGEDQDTYVHTDAVAGTLGSNQTGGPRGDLDSETYVVARALTTKHRLGDTSEETFVTDQRAFRKAQKAQKAHDGDDCERWEEADADDTLDANGLAARTATAIIAAPLTAGGSPNSNAPGRRKEDDENLVVGPSLTSMEGGGPGVPAVAFNVFPAHGQGSDLEAAETDVAGALSSKNEGVPGYDRGTRVVEPAEMAVRRLTPTECERLQGFPDGWTADQADSTRYRQLGNAVAVPVVEWIARRLMANIVEAGK